MIQLLFLILFVEGAITFLLLIKIGPLRELVIKSLDQMKMGKGPATVKTIAGTMAVILFSNLMSIVKIQNKGVVLFLGFVIDRMHHYMRKLINLRGNVGSSREELEQLQKERAELKEKEEKASKEIKQLQEKLSSMSERVKKAETECKEKERKLEAAETHVAALQKQSAELLLEYDSLLEDNQKLQSQILGKTKS
ncbi:hypothetical protein F2Q69_00024739 [Brassica cretica]|uniref:Endoplasmic reticulum transmembrane protein n=1 Tax=Brassica cretica TaxID=69181 RepID=A0A8S9QPX9_BRACR|nr:hypothetical protein F2Q69_00024739 [Brassica cretica]